jgi:UDP-N-acetylmuramyl pentapeptide phosphotransferase/UDP-N-acetylglucosamine-1-phosphate transferase
MTLFVVLPLASALVSYGAAEVIRRHSVKLGFIDLPNSRSLHTATTPRGGGVGFTLAVPAAIAYGMYARSAPLQPEGSLLLAGVGLAAVGLADDRWRLPAGARLLAQALAALIVVSAGGVLTGIAIPGGAVHHLGAAGIPATLLWLVGMTNVYNFMDGIDGLAATQAIITAAAMSIVAICLGREDVAIAMSVLGAGVLGFLTLNWAPARIFMGDVGSTFLGFMLAGWAVVSAGQRSNALPLFAWVAVLSPFLFDALYTLARRAAQREPLHKAHHTHMYQLLVRAGWSHTRTTLLYAGMASSAGLFTVLFYGLHLISPAVYLAAVLIPLAALLLLVARVRRPA